MVSKLNKQQQVALYNALKAEQALPSGKGLKLAGQGNYAGMGLDLPGGNGLDLPGGQGLDLPGGKGKKKRSGGNGGYKRHMVKGSEEAKNHMAKLRAMRKKK